VTNLPETQRIEGMVSVTGPVKHAALVMIAEVEVPPVPRDDINRLIDAGTVSTEGFGAVVLSLTGQSKGQIRAAGEVGAILVPDVGPVSRALQETRQLQFPLEVKAGAGADATFFSSDQPRYVVGFPEYRVMLYNTTDKTVVVDLFAYLTN